MLVSELIPQIFYIYRGKTASRVPAAGTEKYNLYLAIANRKQDEWATDPANRWDSLFETRSLGTLDVNTASYDLPTDFFTPSDTVRVVKTDGSYVDYPIVRAQRRNYYDDQTVYISGTNPQTITFSQDIDTQLDGGTIYISGYFKPTHMVDADDVITVDDPNWLAYATAAELSRNDPAKEDQFANILQQANDLYRKMIDKNNGGAWLQSTEIPTNVPQIGVPDDGGFW